MKMFIETDREYEATLADIARFEESLAQPSDGFGLQVAGIVRGNIAEDLRVMRLKAEAYDLVRAGRAITLDLPSIDDLPDVFIFARHALDLSEAEFAACLGVAESDVRAFEESRYAHVTLGQATHFVHRLGLFVAGEVLVPLPATTVAATGHT